MGPFPNSLNFRPCKKRQPGSSFHPLYTITRQRITSFHQGIDQQVKDSPGAFDPSRCLFWTTKRKKSKYKTGAPTNAGNLCITREYVILRSRRRRRISVCSLFSNARSFASLRMTIFISPEITYAKLSLSGGLSFHESELKGDKK